MNAVDCVDGKSRKRCPWCRKSLFKVGTETYNYPDVFGNDMLVQSCGSCWRAIANSTHRVTLEPDA